MNRSFSIVERGALSLLVYTPWWEEGISHGMTLRPFSFGADATSSQVSEFCDATETTLLVNPRQTHGHLFFDARDRAALEAQRRPDGSLTRFGEYDAILAPVAQSAPHERIAYAIATADCVPVVMRGVAGWALVHAGWRGLANGIIGSVARTLGALEKVVIFGCAGGASYEVGQEVVQAVGDTAAFRLTKQNTFFLDTAETARRQVLPYIIAECIETSGICTIEDSRFHSYRRDGAEAGRSVTFVSPPGCSA